MRSQSIAAASAVLLPAANAALFESVVTLADGSPVQGYAAFNSSPVNMTLNNWASIGYWKGIPYGADTTGANRFRAPQPRASWNTTFEAKEQGLACLSSGTTYVDVGEDCLNLNVWSAANSTSDKLPVVMWSYPAGGSAADPRFDGGGLADKGIVFVNYNRRDGPSGWIVTPELNEERYAETGVNSSGNYGMLDQFAAVEWIRTNIASFGGDPDHITVMGQSAGSAATYHILNSQLLEEGAIVGAIIQSGVRDPHDPLAYSLAEGYQSLEVTQEYSLKWMAENTNCTTIACLREVSADTLNVQTSPGTTDATFKPCLDYYAIPDTYLNTLEKGLAFDVPVMTGNTRDESGASYGLNMTLDEYETEVNATYSGEYVQRFLEAYPANDSATAAAAYNAQFTDRSKVGTMNWAKYWYSNATSPVYTYLWDHAPPGQSAGAAHMTEIQYSQNNLYNVYYGQWEAEDYAIAETLSSYWANFIKTGDPNGDGLVAWPAANTTSTASLNTQEVGDGWGPIPVGDDEQIELITEWLNTQTPL